MFTTIWLLLTLISPINMGRYTPFTTVPFEIIVEIMNQLDWHSLLNIRQVNSAVCNFHFKAHLIVVQTCNLFNGISRARAVWLSQYHQYVARRVWTNLWTHTRRRNWSSWCWVLTSVGDPRMWNSPGIAGYGGGVLQPLIFFQEAGGCLLGISMAPSQYTT